jgi:hypothetical protein
MSDTPVICGLIDDLIFATRVSSVAGEAGVRYQALLSADGLADRLFEASAVALLVDLDWSRSDPIEAIRSAAEDRRLGSLEIVAFGPHVQGDRLAAATDAGATEAMPRSRFAGHLPVLLGRLGDRRSE